MEERCLKCLKERSSLCGNIIQSYKIYVPFWATEARGRHAVDVLCYKEDCALRVLGQQQIINFANQLQKESR